MVDEIKIIYKIKEDKKIRIFGDEFVENNKQNCKIKIHNKIKELTAFYIIDESNENDKLIIQLIGIKKIKNMSYIFTNVNHYYHCQIFLSGILLILKK